jgi:hypothetical protein
MSAQSEYDPKTEKRAMRRLAIYVFFFVLVSAVLLSVNTLMVYSLAQGIGKLLPEIMGISIVSQLMIFIGPMVLLYLEWFLWDVLSGQFSAFRIRSSRRRVD